MQSNNVNVFVQTTHLVFYDLTILAIMSPLVLIVVQELVLGNGFEQEILYVLYIAMEEPEPLYMHVEIKVSRSIIYFR